MLRDSTTVPATGLFVLYFTVIFPFKMVAIQKDIDKIIWDVLSINHGYYHPCLYCIGQLTRVK